MKQWAIGIVLAAAGAAWAAPPPPPPPGQAAAPPPASTQAFQNAMDKMHGGMDVTYTGDADRDFVAGMIPHHQGAIDMAQVELQYGRDPKIRQLAARIISAQEHEIEMMKAWAAKRHK